MQTTKRIKADKVAVYRRSESSSIFIVLSKKDCIRSVYLKDETAKKLADTLEVNRSCSVYGYRSTIKSTHHKDYITLEISVDYSDDVLYIDLDMEAYSELTADLEALL